MRYHDWSRCAVLHHPHWMIWDIQRPLVYCRVGAGTTQWLEEHCGPGRALGFPGHYGEVPPEECGALSWVAFFVRAHVTTEFVVAFREFNHAVLYKLRYG